VGLLKALVRLPLAPVRGAVALAEQIQQQAEAEFYDPARIRAEIEAIAVQRHEHLISDEEADQREELLLQRLLTARDRAREGAS